MRPWFALLLVASGCGGSTKASDKIHFDTILRPALEGDVASVLPGVVTWGAAYDRMEQDGMAPIPRTIGHTYGREGTVKGVKFTAEGEYQTKNPHLVFTRIRITPMGKWPEAGFPANALTAVGFDPGVVKSFSSAKPFTSGPTAKKGSATLSLQLMSSGGDYDKVHHKWGPTLVTSFELVISDPKPR